MTDWYRNTDWNDEIEAAFFAKLERARSQRDQYIVIQAIHLSNSHPEVTLRLVDFYFQTRTDDFHDPRARRAASSAHFALGGFVKALDNYLAILEGGDGERDLHVGSPLVFSFLAARYRSEAHYPPALKLISDLALPDDKQLEMRFQFFAARALLLSQTGKDPVGALRDARIALDLPEELLSQYPDMIWRLRGITRS